MAAERHLARVDLDDPAGCQGAEHRPGRAVDQHCIGTLKRRGLLIDAVGQENFARRIEGDHEDIRPDTPYSVLPFGITEVDRGHLLHIWRAVHPFEEVERKGAGLSLVLVLIRREQQVEPHVLVEQKTAARHGVEEPELNEDEEDRHEDPDQGKRRPPLVVGQDTPGERNLHG